MRATIVISIRAGRRIIELLEEKGINVSEKIKLHLELLTSKVKTKKFIGKLNRFLDI